MSIKSWFRPTTLFKRKSKPNFAERRAKWVAALRGGTYKKCFKFLKCGDC